MREAEGSVQLLGFQARIHPARPLTAMPAGLALSAGLAGMPALQVDHHPRPSRTQPDPAPPAPDHLPSSPGPQASSYSKGETAPGWAVTQG